MTPDEKLAALGLADVEVIDVDEYNRLPAHRRAVINVPAGARFMRLPDPPPVAALRRVFAMLESLHVSDDAGGAIYEPLRVAGEALAEFDGTTM